MRTPSGKNYSPRRQALRALRNARTRAAQHTDSREQAATWERGCRTAESWLDHTHPKLSE